MRKIFIVLLIGFSCVSFAQKGAWTVELSSGFRSEFFESSDFYNSIIHTSGKKLSTPQIEAAVWFGLTDYFAIESGLAYVEYYTNWWDFHGNIPKHKAYSALQMPLRVRFSVPIAKSNFHFFSSAGMVFQFPLQNKYFYALLVNTPPYTEFFGNIKNDKHTEYHLKCKTPLRSFNLLINTKLGFLYQFDFGLGVSVFGEYYKGMRTMVEIHAEYINEYYSYFRDYNSKGDYWNAGIGISYSFKNTNIKTVTPKF